MENVARFKPAEMAAGLDAINNELRAAYTLAYMFMTNDQANKVCKNRSIVANDSATGLNGFTVSLQSPADLGWQKNATVSFRYNVAQLMQMAPEDVQTVVILAIPTIAINASGRIGQNTFIVDDPQLLTAVEGRFPIYSAAHIQKVYQLESASLVQARKELATLRASEDGENRAELKIELERTIKLMLDDSAKPLSSEGSVKWAIKFEGDDTLHRYTIAQIHQKFSDVAEVCAGAILYHKTRGRATVLADFKDTPA